MKRFFFSTLFFSLMVVGVQAQAPSCCSKSKTASSKSCESKSSATSTASASTVDAAAKLASMDESIESKTCPVSGKVSYTKKESNTAGEVSYVDVNYDAETNTFVNASPMKMEGGKACTDQQKAAGCCSGKSASATSAAGCCSGKNASKSTSTSTTGTKAIQSAKPTKG